jgi:hypothetical protein
VTRRTTYSALALALLLGACESPVSTPDTQEAPATLTLSVDWAALDRVASASVPAANGAALLVGEVPNDPYPVNRVGVRIEYPNEDAVFMQTVDRATAEQSGLITLVLPPTNSAKLYALAVHEKVTTVPGADQEVAKALAYADLGRLVPGRAFKITTSSIAFSPAGWTFNTPVLQSVVNGRRVGTATSTGSSFTATVDVDDPFGDVAGRPGVRRFLELNGNGNVQSVVEGKRQMTITVNKGSTPTGQTSQTTNFNPYVNGAHFNLGDAARFAVLPLGGVRVTWAAPTP